MNLNEKNVIITGANRGIGKAMVTAFAESGYNVWACARRQNDEFITELEQLKEKTGRVITPIFFDITNEEETKEGMKKIFSEKRNIDVLINNAGMAHGGLMTMTSIDKIKEVYEVNVFAQIRIMQLAARQMMKQKRGNIINICSVGGIEATPGSIAYGSSKAAFIWITKSLAKELGGYNIRVNGIAPGLIDTEMGYYKNDNERAKVFDRMTIKRMGKPEEVAQSALFLASESSAFMTGQIVVLDGGRI